MVGLRPEGFGIFIGVLMFEALISIALGLCVSAAVPTVGELYRRNLFLQCFIVEIPFHTCPSHAEAANAVGPPLMIIGSLFAGFYIKISSLPIVADWVPYFSLFRWAFEVQ